MYTPHPLVITHGGTDVDWTHPDHCPAGQHCEIARRTHELPLHYMAALANGRPDGAYLLSLYGIRGLCLVDTQGRILPDPPAAAA